MARQQRFKIGWDWRHGRSPFVDVPYKMNLRIAGSERLEMDHIPGAKNIPLEEIIDKADQFRSFNSPVVLYCRSGNRSGMAVSILKQNGLDEVYNGGSLDQMKIN